MPQELNLVDETGKPLAINLVDEGGRALGGDAAPAGPPSQKTADYIYSAPTMGTPTRPGLATSRGGYILNPMNPNAKPSGNITAFTDDGRLINVTVSPTLPKDTYQGIIAREASRTAKPYDIADHPQDVAAMSPGLRTLMNIGITGRMLGNTAKKFGMGAAEFLGSIDENPLAAGAEMVRGIAGSPTATKESLNTVLEGAKAGDIKQMGAGTDRFITEAAPGLMGLEGGMRLGVKGAGAAVDYAKAAPERAQIRSIDNFSEVIKSGVEGPPQFHAETAQPFARQFVQEAGIDPRRVLPSGGAQDYLLQGGSAADLAKLNTALKAEWVRTGGKAADFVPANSVAMAIADGMVNVADRPIANAVRAVADRDVPQVQNGIVAKMRAAARSTPDAALRSAMENVADEIDAGGSTVGGIDNLKAHFNKEAGKFYRGTPSSQSAATATSAYAYKYAADLIREDLYPWLEENTTAKGLADAGRAEASAIASRDGIYKSWTRAAKLNSNAGVQKFLDYVANGPEGLAQGATKPATTVAGIATRAAGYPFKQMPLGEFNTLLRRGIGDISNFKPMDASALPTTTAPPVGYGRFRSQQGPTPTQAPTNQSAGDAIQAILNRPRPNVYGIDPNAPNVRPAATGNVGDAGALTGNRPAINPYGIDPSKPNVAPTPTGNVGNAGALTGNRPPINPYGIDTGITTNTPPTPTGNVGSGGSLTASEAASSIMKGDYSDLQNKLGTPSGPAPGAPTGDATSLTMQKTAPTGYPQGGPQSGPAPPRGGGSMNSLTAEPLEVEGEGDVEGGGGEGGETPAAPKPAPKKPAPKKPAPKKAEAAPAKPASGKPELADFMAAKMLNMTIDEYMKTKKR